MKSCRAFTHFVLLVGLAVLLLPTLADARGRGFKNDAEAFSARGRQGDQGVILVGKAPGRAPRVILFPQTLRLSQRPPGWDRGRKVGWGDCDVPPGLAKKFGCREGFFTGRRVPRQGPVIVIPVP